MPSVVTMNLNKFERARIIGARALQLANGAPPLIEVSGQINPIAIAQKELETGIIPLAVVR
jgi:DNA-directed RNA polymerase subunit K/omega